MWEISGGIPKDLAQQGFCGKEEFFLEEKGRSSFTSRVVIGARNDVIPLSFR